MAPTEEDRFAAAEQRWASGNASTAVAIHLDLIRHANNPDLRLRSALLLVERLHPVSNVKEIVESCSTGAEMAAKLGDDATRAYLMGMKAKNLAIQTGSIVMARTKFKMAPGWLGFSLVRDEEEHKSLSARIEADKEEIDKLIQEAQNTSRDDPATRGHVLLSLGNISLQRYFDLKLDSVKVAFRLPAFVREFLRSYALDEYFWYSASDRQAMRCNLKECVNNYSDAVTAFRAADDELNVARAFYAAANDLRSANRFREAKRYLKQAEMIVKRRNDPELLERIPVLKERIRRRNRNTPNYAARDPRPVE
jgi:hypothetical protein